MKYLTAIFSYNRPYLLINAVESFLEFGPAGDLLIVDDGSDHPELLKYLEQLESRVLPNVFIWRLQRQHDRRLGGLYPNMEAATAYAMEKGYDYLLYSQDDQQFMWKDESFWEKVAAIYAHHPDTFMVRPAFDKLIFSHDHRNRFDVCPSCHGIRFKKAGFSAVGLVSIKKVKELNWHFQPTEVENEKVVLSLDMTMHLMKTAILAPVPVPETWRFGQQQGKIRKPVRQYFLKPLGDEQIRRLQSSGGVPLLEEYCLPWGWKCWAPYNHSTDHRKYFENLWRWFKKSRLRRWPKWQGAQ